MLYPPSFCTLILIEELSASLLTSLTDLWSVMNRIEFVSLTQKFPRTLTGRAIKGGAKCSDLQLLSPN